ncbi:hypothetical protein EFL81_09910 [Weissella confusa]|uniref:hypothetical protein n=1 Tax=Weissella confusa TaxID=1583 RepID=UPI00223C0B69|nr:hypothetical protein [Weissella confusa]MCS9997125.1 hypothetical protein [Weissella confusa]
MSEKPDFKTVAKKTLKKPQSVLGGDSIKTPSVNDTLEYDDFMKRFSESTGADRLTTVISPELKKLVNVAGKQRGRSKGGVKGIVEDALIAYFKMNWSEFDFKTSDIEN